MTITFAVDELERLTCALDRDKIHAVATSSDLSDAVIGMKTAIDSLEANGHGECFWKEAGGEYRWVFRREGDNVRVAVLWTIGVMTGWEHIFWAERPMAEVVDQIRAGLPKGLVA